MEGVGMFGILTKAAAGKCAEFHHASGKDLIIELLVFLTSRPAAHEPTRIEICHCRRPVRHGWPGACR
jgi:hypothetical protein